MTSATPSPNGEGEPAGIPAVANAEQLQASLEVWKTTIQVQQHFNDIEMRVRNYALTVLVAVIGAAGLALREEAVLELGRVRISLAVVLLAAGVLVWAAFWFMDDIWYHRLLLGAVRHAIDLEQAIAPSVPGIGLSTQIRDSSAVRIRKRSMRSTHKIRLFYGTIGVILLGLTIAVASTGGIEPGDEARVRRAPTPEEQAPASARPAEGRLRSPPPRP